MDRTTEPNRDEKIEDRNATRRDQREKKERSSLKPRKENYGRKLWYSDRGKSSRLLEMRKGEEEFRRDSSTTVVG